MIKIKQITASVIQHLDVNTWHERSHHMEEATKKEVQRLLKLMKPWLHWSVSSWSSLCPNLSCWWCPFTSSWCQLHNWILIWREKILLRSTFFCHIILYSQGDDGKEQVLPKRAQNPKWQLKTISAAILSFGLGLISIDKGFTTQLSSLFKKM